MLRSITQLVPFGDDMSARPISVLYLANIGRSVDKPDGFCDYIISYYEQPSHFSKGIRYFKHIKDYYRHASNFAMNHKIYSTDFPWLTEKELLDNSELNLDYTKMILSKFDERAMQDIGWNGDK